MSHIIAGDPAPTNSTARMVGVTNRLILGILAGEERKPLLDAYRAEVRAEVLAEAIKAASAEYQPQDITAPRTPYNEGVSDAVSALYRLAKGGPVKRAEELQAAADWLMSQGHTIAARDLDRYIAGGESRG